MNKSKNKRKEIIIIGVLILLMIVIIVGTSYAAFRYGGIGSTENSITTGAITMKYTETSNGITLSGALPTTDKTGTVRLTPGEYFDFNISSTITGNTNINYEISAKKEDGNTIDGKYIKLYLTKINSDGTEEALMVPEVYSEETSANNYTGRPSNEMSLYTSSMNSSENNNYRLRMYVDESYNPQGDGGGLTFTVKINVYGKAGDKYVPETTTKILADNELQEEKENMFNYASNGTQYDPSNANGNWATTPNPEYITNGLYSSEDEDGISYYYRGNVDNNNVQFGEYTNDYYVYYDGAGRYFQTLESCEAYTESISYGTCTQVKLASAGDKMYWKIVRINGDGSLRLIYNGTSTETIAPTNKNIAGTYAVGVSPYTLISQADAPKYAGYTYDRDTNETDSFIKKEVDTWYENVLEDTIYDSKVSSGRFCSDSSGYNYDGNGYFASYDRLGQAYTNFAKSNSPTLRCPSTNESYGGSYRLKAGLITADEMVFVGESVDISSNTYLTQGDNGNIFLTMSPGNYNNMNFIFASYYGLGALFVASNASSVRPVINVSTDNGFTSGDGTASNPYIIN